MTDQQRLTIRAELARRMGCVIENVTNEPSEPIWAVTQKPDGLKLEPIGFYKGSAWSIPDPFTNAADKDALVEWLAADDARWFLFIRSLVKLLPKPERDEIRDTTFRDLVHDLSLFMAAPRETITLAACKALGIETE